ncbi:hypothetical protein GC173_12275 [bacterium]|nr:hypothetical protein [bacterium]
MSQSNPTTMFAMRRTVFGSNLMDTIESMAQSSGTKGGLKIGFFPCGPESFDNRALSELAISAMSVRRKVATVYLDPAIIPAKGLDEDVEALEQFMDETSMKEIPRRRSLVLRCSPAAPGTSGEATSRGLYSLVSRLAADYDLVLLVASDTLKSSLGVAVANTCDQCYLFVHQGTTGIGDVERVRQRLELSAAKACGVIYTGRSRLIPDWLYNQLFARNAARK